MKKMIVGLAMMLFIASAMAEKPSEFREYISARTICKSYVEMSKQVLQTAGERGISIQDAYRAVIPQQNENIIPYFVSILHEAKGDPTVHNPDELLLGVCIQAFYGQRSAIRAK